MMVTREQGLSQTRRLPGGVFVAHELLPVGFSFAAQRY